ncbi:hypothetical protein SDC9_158219 [bioreactor metagenome]|uniref:Uncharacterized protein n=1 Tax=bioreactor metagenome TaxID=1076179 RepID=A0A645FBI1_9ZZZZ
MLLFVQFLCLVIKITADSIPNIPRTGMDHHAQESLFIRLQLDEVIPAAERPCLKIGFIQYIGKLLGCSHLFLFFQIPGKLPDSFACLFAFVLLMAVRNAAQNSVDDGLRQFPLGRLTRNKDFHGNIGLHKSHATADIGPNRIRDDHPFSSQDASDGHAVPSVGIRHERDVLVGERQIGQIFCLFQTNPIQLACILKPNFDRDFLFRWFVQREHISSPMRRNLHSQQRTR